MNHSSTPAKEDQLQPLGKRLVSNRYYQLLEIILVFLPPALAIVGVRLLDIESPLYSMGALYVANILMLALVWLGIKLRGETLGSIGVSPVNFSLSGTGLLVLKSIPILLVAVLAFILGTIIMANIVTSAAPADLTQYNYLQGNLLLLIASLFGVYLISSFGEEVIYRGFLITRIQALFGGDSKLGVIAALTISAIIFGLAHFSWGITGIVQTTFMGAAFGAAFFWTKKILWPLVLAHVYMDTLLLVPLYFGP